MRELILVAIALLGCGKSEKKKPVITLGSGSAAAGPGDATATAALDTPAAVDAAPFGKQVATKLVAGGKTTCALLPDATLKCWGHNEYGQLGDGTTKDSGTPVAVTGVTDVKDLVIDATSACALKGDGTVACWGRLGDGKDRLATPTALDGVAGATRFVGGSCVAVANDDVMCWRAFPFVKTPGKAVLVPELAKATAYLDGGLAVYADGTSKFLDEVTKKLVPSPLTGALEIQSHAPDDVFCGRFDNGAVKCFGYSMKCKLGQPDAIMSEGDGGSPFTTKLVELKLPPAKELAMDLSENLCIVTSEDRLQCVDVGDASYKNCGRVHSALLESVKFVTGNCAVLGDGSVNCVMLDKRRRMMVGAVAGSSRVTQLAMSYSHGCALAPTGVYCWGANDRGQLGQGTVDKAAAPEGWKPVINAVPVKL